MSFFSSFPQTYSLIICFSFQLISTCAFPASSICPVPLLWPHFLSSLLQSICSQSRLKIFRAPIQAEIIDTSEASCSHIPTAESNLFLCLCSNTCSASDPHALRVFTHTHTHTVQSLWYAHTHTLTLLLMQSILIILTQIDTSTY